MQREHTLDTDTSGDTPHGEAGCRALAVLQLDHHALEDLDPFSFTFPDAEVHPDSVARVELGNPGVGVFLK